MQYLKALQARIGVEVGAGLLGCHPWTFYRWLRGTRKPDRMSRRAIVTLEMVTRGEQTTALELLTCGRLKDSEPTPDQPTNSS